MELNTRRDPHFTAVVLSAFPTWGEKKRGRLFGAVFFEWWRLEVISFSLFYIFKDPAYKEPGTQEVLSKWWLLLLL